MPAGIYVRTEEHKRNLGNALKGKRRTPEQIQRMREAHKGIPSGRKGKHYPDMQGGNSPFWKGGRPLCAVCGKPVKYGATHCIKHCHNGNHNAWKGDNVTISSLHDWIKCHKPKVELCEYCHQKPPYDCANISGKYLRDINDYEWLCRRCHMLKDGRLAKTIARNKAMGSGVWVIF